LNLLVINYKSEGHNCIHALEKCPYRYEYYKQRRGKLEKYKKRRKERKILLPRYHVNIAKILPTVGLSYTAFGSIKAISGRDLIKNTLIILVSSLTCKESKPN
jgi:hypothetical protein